MCIILNILRVAISDFGKFWQQQHVYLFEIRVFFLRKVSKCTYVLLNIPCVVMIDFGKV
jgi:hypothetical protein